MSAASRNKGAGGERELAAALHEQLGVRLVRNLTQARNGGFDLAPADGETGPVAACLRGLALEVKRHASAPPGQVRAWWAQTERQGLAAGKVPILAFRPDRGEWRVRVPLSLVRPDLAHASGVEWSAELSLAGFCYLVRESAG